MKASPGRDWWVRANGFGLDPSLPARVIRTEFIAAPTVLLSFRQRHRIKVGGLVSVPSFEYAFPNRGVGAFAYSSASEVASGDGAFRQIAGPRPLAKFSLPRVSAFVQYVWDALPGLQLTGGFRYDAEFIPADDLPVNSDWLDATGLGADTLKSVLHKFSPRVGIRWDLTGQGNTVFVAGAGVHQGNVDPAALGEAFAYGGGVGVRRGVGGLGAWPNLPDETIAPVIGETTTLVSPGLESPPDPPCRFRPVAPAWRKNGRARFGRV